MIPKKIHYVWLGGNPIPDEQQRYMSTWTTLMPDWEIVGWTEQSIADYCAKNHQPSPLSNNHYCREALAARKYAFVSDYIRLWALEREGGIYMDTDVEVLRPFSELSVVQDTHISAFIGFEDSLAHLPGTCVMGCQAHCQWVQDMLASYDGISFCKDDGSLDLTTNVQRMGCEMMARYGLVPNGKEQTLRVVDDELLMVYDHHVFSPITSTRVMRKNAHTFCVHHFAGSWTGKKGKNHWTNHPFFREIINALIQVKRFLKGQN